MNNLLSHCGLVDARISASEKDLPVTKRAAISVDKPLNLLASNPYYTYSNLESLVCNGLNCTFVLL